MVNLITNLHGLCFRLDPEGPSKSLISKSYLDIKFDYLYVTDELIFYALKGYVGKSKLVSCCSNLQVTFLFN